jgi:hypothetical protein
MNVGPCPEGADGAEDIAKANSVQTIGCIGAGVERSMWIDAEEENRKRPEVRRQEGEKYIVRQNG